MMAFKDLQHHINSSNNFKGILKAFLSFFVSPWPLSTSEKSIINC